MGYASFPFLPEQPATLSWEQVIDIADRALYAAKKSGRNRCVGIAANAKTIINNNKDRLYLRISSNLPAMIENNELTVISTTEKSLVWD
jgi:GGDEF domain-containing protein